MFYKLLAQSSVCQVISCSFYRILYLSPRLIPVVGPSLKHDVRWRTHGQVSVSQDHLLSFYDGLQDPIVERLRQVEVLHRHVCRDKLY